MKPDSLKQKEEGMKFDLVAGILNLFNEVGWDDMKTELQIRH